MTANKNEQGSEPGRPAWAAGLDLSSEAYRPDDDHLTERHFHAGIRRRLADAEMRVAELEWELASEREHRDALQAAIGMRGEPDFLIDVQGVAWQKLREPTVYRSLDGTGDWERPQIDHLYGPVVEVWK